MEEESTAMKRGVALVLSMFAGGVGGAFATSRIRRKEILYWKALSDKHLALLQLLNQWMLTKQRGKSIVDFFHKNAIKCIGIYGMSYVGECLVEELKNTEIEVKYAIDQNRDGIYVDVDVISLDEELEKVDAIIVTPITSFQNIKEMLSEKVDYRIISLEEIIYTL